MLTSGDEVDVSATLSPGAGNVIGEGTSACWIPSGEPADPKDTGESEKTSCTLLLETFSF